MVMADSGLVLCEPLCFLLNKFKKQPQLNVLKQAVVDFYCIDDIIEAKQRLLDDVGLLSISDKIPHIPKRRDGVNRVTKEVDDIILLLTSVDEQGLLNSLPRYAAINPDNMPSLRLFDGDMLLLLTRLDKMESKLMEFGSALAAINSALRSSTTISSVSKASSTSTSLPTTTTLPAVLPGVYQSIGCHGILPSAASAVPASASDQAQAPAQPKVQSAYTVPDLQLVNNTVNNTGPSWAERVASTPIGHRLVSDSNYDSNGESAEDQGFIVQQSRKKRKRQLSQQPSQQQATGNELTKTVNDNSIGRPVNRHGRHGRRLLIGKMIDPSTSSHFVSHSIAAAKPLLKKAVYYIDNVDSSVNIDDMREFVTGLSVQVLSLFETKPRRRSKLSSSSALHDGKAFRLCINKDHRDRLLDDSRWPAYVSVSEWFFKSAQSADGHATVIVNENFVDQNTAAQPNLASATLGSASETIINRSVVAEGLDEDDEDATVMLTDHSQPECIT